MGRNRSAGDRLSISYIVQRMLFDSKGILGRIPSGKLGDTRHEKMMYLSRSSNINSTTRACESQNDISESLLMKSGRLVLILTSRKYGKKCLHTVLFEAAS
jgi:hypothetical protein